MTSRKAKKKSQYSNYSEGMKPPTLKVALFGTFDVDNFGDCLFPLIVEHHLAKRLGKVRLYPFSPSNRVARIANYSRVYAFNELTQTFREPPSCFIIGGGELLATTYGLSVYPQVRNLLYPFSLKTWLLPIMVANTWNCPCVLNAVGMGRFDKEFNEITTAYLTNLDLCLVRDPFTAERLSRIDIAAEVVPDSAFSVPNLLTTSQWAMQYHQLARDFNLPGKFLAVQASFGYLTPNHLNYANVVGRVAANTGLPIVLVPICHQHSDIQSVKMIRKALRKQGVETYLINRILTTLQTSSILANSEMYIGTSLHGAIVSLAFGKPVVSYSKSKTGKHRGVLSVVGLEICHVSHEQEIPDKASKLMQVPKTWFREKIQLANSRVNEYFDRVSNIIMAKNCSSIPKGWNQNTATGEVTCGSTDDFRKLKQLCLAKKREINPWKRYVHCLIRKNYTISVHYDRLMFWLREHGVLSHWK